MRAIAVFWMLVFLPASEAARDPKHLASDMVDWTNTAAFPLAKSRTSQVFRGEAAKSGFNLHSYLAFYEGRYFSIWSQSAVGEEDPDQHLVYATSRDGRQWSAPQVLAADPDGPDGPARWIARGLFILNGRLTALGARIESADYGKRGKSAVWKALRLMYFQWQKGRWEDKGVFAEDCMNNFPPELLGERLAMICRDRNMDVSVALLRDGPGFDWQRVPLTGAPPFDRMDEPTWYQDPDGAIHMIIRDNNRSRKLIRTLSRDGGRTWEGPVLTDYPDATSKNFTGKLSNGWYYLINNPNPAGRDPLTISFSSDGWVFAKPLAIRRGAPARRVAGRAKGSGSLQYPHAIEHNGSLWVIYSVNKEDIEISELRIRDVEWGN